MAMRIVGGRFRAKRLIAPQGSGVRPTSDRAREALFNVLEHGEPPVQGAGFLDLFAGTGAVGIEAYSRGAATVVLIENAPDAVRAIRANLEALGKPEDIRLLERDANRPGRAPGRFDLVFVDPPYGSGLAVAALEALRGGWLAEEARVVVELAAKEGFDPPVAYEIERERRYGAARLIFLRPRA